MQPVTAAVPGQDLVVGARITAPSRVKWARLRYRHVSQYEDYQTAEMKLDAATGLYKASIPAAFIDAKWDLMYFVEVVDRAGAGRIYPDLARDAVRRRVRETLTMATVAVYPKFTLVNRPTA